MNITIIGAGAMGGLFASLLSKNNNITIIDNNSNLVDEINSNGFTLIDKNQQEHKYRFRAATSPLGMDEQDLIIIFVKSMFNKTALDNNKSLIGKNTFIMSLQNGMGHEVLLQKYADNDHVIMGTTQHNSAIIGLAKNAHKGIGPTAICSISGNTDLCAPIAKTFTEAGIETHVDINVKRMIWNKLFTNASASILTGILQVKLGYIATDEYAYSLCKKLIQETILVAKADGFDFDYDQKLEEVTKVCTNAPEGVTSIYFDLKNHKKTEVDTISGAVLALGEKYGIETPITKTAVYLVHALENRLID